MKCTKCSGKMAEKSGATPEGVEYHYHKCVECGEEIVDMAQLHAVAEKYRKMKRYTAKLSRWGESMGLRIPKELVKKYKLKENEELSLIPEEKAIKIMAE